MLLIEREETPDFVKVFDFGLAKLIGKDADLPTHSTGSGIVMGTPFYMSPEQCTGSAEVDQRCDIYALGVILFEMLTGHVPFTGEGYGEVMLKHVNEPPPSAVARVPSLPPAVDQVLARAMAKNPAARYQTMAELRAALIQLATAFTPTAVSSRRLKRITPASVLLAGTGELVEGATRKPPVRHRGLFLVGAAALALAAVANVGFRRAAPPAAAAAPAPIAARAAANPETVRVNFSSDPAGARVSRPDGTVLGVTPMSTEVAYSDTPIEVVLDKPGFAPKTVTFVPNMPIPVLAVLKKQGPTPTQAASVAPRARASRVTAAATPTRRAQRFEIDHDDDVLAPTTW